MTWIAEIASEMWRVAQQMAPYLLLGFLMAGGIAAWLPPELVGQHLGGTGLRQIMKASLFGIPLPLCSCSVLPVSVSLRRHGASREATLSFLASTPQTGVDSILVTHGMLGPVFAATRVVTALINGVLAGLLMKGLSQSMESSHEDRPPGCHHREAAERARSRLVEAFRYGFGTLAGELSRPVLVGMALAGVLTALVPENYFADKMTSEWGTMFTMLVVGIPLYVCSSGSVPLAYALLKMGFSPGAVLVFLVAGPATNAAAVTTIWKVLGRRALGVYLLSIVVSALGAGYALNRMTQFFSLPISRPVHHGTLGPAHAVSAVLLLLVLVPPALRRRAA